MSSKFSKNLEFISENPEFISDKLSKMSRILSSHIVGIKKLEQEIDLSDFDTLKKHVRSLMMVNTNLSENLYIINLIVMMFISNDTFKDKSKKAIENLLNILNIQDHEHEVDKEENKIEQLEKENVTEINNQKEKQEPEEAPVKVRKKRGRKKSN